MRDLTDEESAYCQAMADAAPPLTDEQRRDIQRLLGPAARRVALAAHGEDPAGSLVRKRTAGSSVAHRSR